VFKQISGRLESLDCSECRRLSQEAFITLARTRIILPRLRHLTVPSDLTLPNAVYETLANSECLPALQCLDNIQPAPTCDPLRCQVSPCLNWRGGFGELNPNCFLNPLTHCQILY